MTSAQAARGSSTPRLLQNVPREFRAWQAAARMPSNVGLVELEVARRGTISRVVHSYQQAPLQFFRPMYLDPVRPDMPFIVLLQQGGGMAQGDLYSLDITCHDDAAVHVTSQSATKLYKCEEHFASQVVSIRAGSGSVVEYLPDVTIPFRDARFYQRIDVRLDPEATVIVGDVLTAGRVAYGEHHDYGIFFAQVNAYALDGRLLAVDTVKLQPALGATGAPAMLGPYAAFCTLTVFSRQVAPAALTTLLRDALAGDAARAGTTLHGVSELPNGCGVSVRMLGPTGAAVEHARAVAWNAARVALLGAPAPDLRKA